MGVLSRSAVPMASTLVRPWSPPAWRWPMFDIAQTMSGKRPRRAPRGLGCMRMIVRLPGTGGRDSDRLSRKVGKCHQLRTAAACLGTVPDPFRGLCLSPAPFRDRRCGLKYAEPSSTKFQTFGSSSIASARWQRCHAVARRTEAARVGALRSAGHRGRWSTLSRSGVCNFHRL